MAERFKDINQDPYCVYDIHGLLKNAMLQNAANFRESRQTRKNNIKGVLESAWGEGIKQEIFTPPSTASNCLKWVGYEALGGYKPAPRTNELEMQSLIGSSAHWSFLKILATLGFQEHEFRTANPRLSGRIDFTFQNPITQEWQLLDLKFVGSFVFKKITREGLNPELRRNKNNYNPAIEAKRQLMLYMWAMSEYGLKIACGHVVYISRDAGTMKTCLVPWGDGERYETEEFLQRIREAEAAIKEGQLPSPSVESKHVCGSLCSYVAYCEHGQQFAKGEIRKVPNRKPAWLKEKITIQKIKRAERMVLQPPLFSPGVFDNDDIDADTIDSLVVSEVTGGRTRARTGGDVYRADRNTPQSMSMKKVVGPGIRNYLF